jgi:hypothetical protein
MTLARFQVIINDEFIYVSNRVFFKRDAAIPPDPQNVS